MGKLFPWVTLSLHTRNQESQDAPHSNALGFIVLAETGPQKGQGCNRVAGLLMVTVAESVLDLDPELWVSLMWGLRRIPTQTSRRLSVWHALATMTSWLLSGFSVNLLQTVTLAPRPPPKKSYKISSRNGTWSCQIVRPPSKGIWIKSRGLLCDSLIETLALE